MKKSRKARAQPAPTILGVSKKMVRQHAQSLFRDKWGHGPLSLREWRLAEKDLARKLEADAL